jgi:SAM-dependent methyltransferase
VKLEQVVPWGRNAGEYRRMFDFKEADLAGRILGCGDGPASFNAELSAAGYQVTSVDPIYAFSGDDIRARVDATYDAIIDQVKLRPDRYVWREFADPDALGAVRMAAMETFLADYEMGKQAGRYVEGALPSLPFDDNRFDLALCSHLLFLYTAHLDADFHVTAVQELLRLAPDIRIFPLLTLECEISPYLAVVMEWCEANGHGAEVCPVPYEFQVGGAMMLQIERGALK